MAEVSLQPEDVQGIITGIATHPEAMESVAQLMRIALNQSNSRIDTNSGANSSTISGPNLGASLEANSGANPQQPSSNGKLSHSFFSCWANIQLPCSRRPTSPLCRTMLCIG